MFFVNVFIDQDFFLFFLMLVSLKVRINLYRDFDIIKKQKGITGVTLSEHSNPR